MCPYTDNIKVYTATQPKQPSHGSIKNIATQHKTQKILIVTGKRSFADSGGAAVNDREVRRFSEFNVNPQFEDALQGICSV